MDINIKNEKLIFTFEKEGEEAFIFNAINFSINILNDEKNFAKQMSKEMLKEIERIEKRFEIGNLLERIDNNIYSADYEDILILFDNSKFIIEALIENLGNTDKDKFRKESYELILDVIKSIVNYIKEETETK